MDISVRKFRIFLVKQSGLYGCSLEHTSCLRSKGTVQCFLSIILSVLYLTIFKYFTGYPVIELPGIVGKGYPFHKVSGHPVYLMHIVHGTCISLSVKQEIQVLYMGMQEPYREVLQSSKDNNVPFSTDTEITQIDGFHLSVGNVPDISVRTSLHRLPFDKILNLGAQYLP